MLSILKLNKRIKDILCCPFCKTQQLNENENEIQCKTCCAIFKVQQNGVVDFRVIPPVKNRLFEEFWGNGQSAYEQWAKNLPDGVDYYLNQIKESAKTYTEFCDLKSIKGIVVDIGGNDGRLRHFLSSSPQCEYVSIDPYLTVREDLSRSGRLEAYPILSIPCDFICGMAEHLPFIHNSVDFCRMNSVLDHLWDANLGMREISRVLKPGGLLFLGVSVLQKKNWLSASHQKAKDIVKCVVGKTDKHVWHPTLEEVYKLTETVGLIKEKEMFYGNELQAILKKPAL
jgi:SAM-dependent methyltransferase